MSILVLGIEWNLRDQLVIVPQTCIWVLGGFSGVFGEAWKSKLASHLILLEKDSPLKKMLNS